MKVDAEESDDAEQDKQEENKDFEEV